MYPHQLLTAAIPCRNAEASSGKHEARPVITHSDHNQDARTRAQMWHNCMPPCLQPLHLLPRPCLHQQAESWDWAHIATPGFIRKQIGRGIHELEQRALLSINMVCMGFWARTLRVAEDWRTFYGPIPEPRHRSAVVSKPWHVTRKQMRLGREQRYRGRLRCANHQYWSSEGCRT